MIQMGVNTYLIDPPGIVTDTLESRNYMMRYDDNRDQYYLEPSSPFTVPDKIYGDEQYLADRYLNSFNTWNSNLGVLLTGLKGTGKSLLARQVCMKSNLPVILISSPYYGPAFLSAIEKLNQPVIIFIDEFEKMYKRDKHQQEHLLSLLDGAFESKIMFLLTANDTNKINGFFMNRPGRIHYRREYSGISDDMIREIGNDQLNKKSNVKGLIKLSNLLGEISMDIVTSLIREMNLYPDDPIEYLLENMNLKAEDCHYNVELLYKGKVVAKRIRCQENPLNSMEVYLSWFGADISRLDEPDFDVDHRNNYASNEYDIHVNENNVSVHKGLVAVTQGDYEARFKKVETYTSTYWTAW